MEIDAFMMNTMRTNQSGSTANIVIIKSGNVFCVCYFFSLIFLFYWIVLIYDIDFICVQGNVGDSRAIAVVNGTTMALSMDHKPTDLEERRRITAAGGWIESNRVNGNLALSRAFGDFNFKMNSSRSPEEQIITGKTCLLLKLILF